MLSSYNNVLYCNHGGKCTCGSDKEKKCFCNKPNCKCDCEHKGEHKDHKHDEKNGE